MCHHRPAPKWLFLEIFFLPDNFLIIHKEMTGMGNSRYRSSFCRALEWTIGAFYSLFYYDIGRRPIHPGCIQIQEGFQVGIFFPSLKLPAMARKALMLPWTYRLADRGQKEILLFELFVGAVYEGKNFCDNKIG